MLSAEAAAELTATPCCHRVYSAAGYSYGSTVFLGLAAAATLAYLLLGVAMGARQGGAPSLRSHPHFEQWKMVAGLVQVPFLPSPRRHHQSVLTAPASTR